MKEGFDPKKDNIIIIENDKEFREAFADAKNQFFAMKFDLENKKLSLEDLQEENKKIEYFNFVDFLENKNVPHIISANLINNEKYKRFIKIHDELIERIKNFKSIEELKQILEESEEFIRQDF